MGHAKNQHAPGGERGDDNLVALPQALVDPVYAGLTRRELADALCREVQGMDLRQLARLSWAVSAATGCSTPLD